MNSLHSDRVAALLEKLHRDADAADHEHITAMMERIDAPGVTVEAVAGDLIAEERRDYRAIYRGYANNFLAVSPDYGRFLYMTTRACRARSIVEFGTSMGVSAIYLAAALRDNGGGLLIGTEIESAKADRARANLVEAGLADLVEIREGDALETLKDVEGEVDMLHLDGAFSLYLAVFRLLEPRLRPGTVILGENAFEPEYLDYVRSPANGYLSQSLPFEEGRGNELTVRTA
ncbi:methyltransferase [Sphingomonas sp. AP4-R1]|uniref:O-methyltransferase n=1 Tax=Sphingomonas sp. AP4-R1 TaxID=2735134 RepID=UPI001493D405|nr:class I SAM-dependent methyltransferase [Sphingomonas sp. AP4-R1]QJU59287.1 methyltransferase [Sphingomonas sp. AP4-R1]